MKEKIKTQKGFIPIILVIVIAVAVISATAGIVKYKDEITASISNVFKSKIETPNVESVKEDEGIEGSKLTEEPILKEEAEIEKKQDDTQQLQGQLRIAEQKRLEAERQLAEEKAKAESEELKRKTEEAKREAEESLKKAQENTVLKIAQCQAKRDADYSDFVSKVDKMIADSVKKLQDQRDDIINQLKQNYVNCLNQANQYNPDMTPQANMDAIERASDICKNYYDSGVQKQKDYTEEQISKVYLQRDTFISQGKSAVDSEYYKCINK